MRRQGQIITLNLASPDQIGCYGLMQASDEFFVWTAAHIYRNGSHPRIGDWYTFDVVEHRYATNIDQLNKEIYAHG